MQQTCTRGIQELIRHGKEDDQLGIAQEAETSSILTNAIYSRKKVSLKMKQVTLSWTLRYKQTSQFKTVLIN